MAIDDEVDLSGFAANLSDIEDLPSFEVPPKGSYKLLVSMGTKKVNDKPGVTADFEVIDTVELANSADKPVPAGSKFNTLYFLDNEYGLGNMKKFLQPFASCFNTESVPELVKEKVQNVVIFATISHRVDREDKTKVYADVKNVSIAD